LTDEGRGACVASAKVTEALADAVKKMPSWRHAEGLEYGIVGISARIISIRRWVGARKPFHLLAMSPRHMIPRNHVISGHAP